MIDTESDVYRELENRMDDAAVELKKAKDEWAEAYMAWSNAVREMNDDQR